jgi:inner membrane protein
MTIYTHAVVGLGIGRVFASGKMPMLFWLLAALLPVIPDLDVFSVAGYGGSILGHRGFTHSISFAVAVGLAAAAVTCRYFQRSFWILFALFAAITASHGFLDALTKGGAGIPFFWPISERRFGGWGPVLVPDIALEIPDPRTSRAVRGELLWVWLPMVVLVALATVYRHRHRTNSATAGKG